MSEIPLEPAGVPRGRAMVERAEWAARAFARYDIESVRRIAKAAAEAGAAHAKRFGDDAVAETGFGVAEHKYLKNISCSTGIWEMYKGHDYVSPRVLEQQKIVEIPRPAGVVLALTPSTNPVATAYFKVLSALLTRNSIIVSPHPYAKKVSAEAVRVMSEAAVAAGAPDGCIQVVEEPSIPLITALMTDDRVAVVVATGGTAMVRAAYRSGNPALGVGPGNVPVLVDASADVTMAARRIVASKSFDNSILCTNESVLIVEDAVADKLVQALRREGAYIASAEEAESIRAVIFDGENFRTSWVGRDATAIAKAAGIRVPAATKILIAPIDLVVPEEMLAHEKLCPVLGMVRVPTAGRGIDAARAVLRITGAGHSAAIHSQDARTIMDFSAAVRVLRVSVNVGNSLGGAGIETNLAPTMTIGTGFFGRSSLGENLEPKHLVNITRIAYNADAAVTMPSFAGIDPWSAPTGPVPVYPLPSNAHESGVAPVERRDQADDGELREEIRRLVIEELRQIIKG
ncbi:MAG: aldehyde dehydrogenase family protein [Actinobacteria bacterium]|nr:aldehyde dehydrogenase family protein [Actinomycetota bacterium]